MSVKDDNKAFWNTYEKLILKTEIKVKQLINNLKYDGNININRIKKLNLIIKYLSNIDESNYEYYRIKGLTEISNYLNKL